MDDTGVKDSRTDRDCSRVMFTLYGMKFTTGRGMLRDLRRI